MDSVVVAKFEEHFNPSVKLTPEELAKRVHLGAAGRFIGWDEDMNAVVLYVRAAGWDKVGEVGQKALESLPSELLAEIEEKHIAFVVKPI